MDMKPTFTDEENEGFIRYLEKVRRNGFFVPTEETFRAVHQTFSQWAPELVILRENGWRNRQILLKVYDDNAEMFVGMRHIPGGYNRWLEGDVQTTCSRVAQREIGIDVVYQFSYPNPYKWQDGEHPYGHPFSVYASCRPLGEIVESENLRFFSVDQLPENLVVPHRRFINAGVADNLFAILPTQFDIHNVHYV